VATGTATSARPPLKTAFRALDNPNYRLYWSAQIVSQAGTWMQSVALSWLVLRLTDSPLALGAVTTVQFLPILLFSLFGGVLADRFPKRRFLLTTQCVMLLQALTLAVLTGTGLIRLEYVYALAAVQGLVNALDNPTRQSFIVELVGPEDLPNAVALNSMQFNLARLVGPALGGITIAVIGVAGCFYINAGSFVAVIGALLLLRPARFFVSAKAAQGRNVAAQIGEGIRYALTTPDIALVVLLTAALGTFGYNFSVVLPLLARYVLHGGPVAFGVLTSSMGVGSLLAALVLAYTGRVTRGMLLAGAAAFSVLLFAVALSHWWAATIPLIVALGVASILFSATANTRLQLVTPPELRGRVMSIYMLLFAGTTPIGGFVVGALADRFGIQAALAVMATICLAGVGAAVLYLRGTRARMLGDDALAARRFEPAPASRPRTVGAAP